MDRQKEIEAMANEIARICPDLVEDNCNGVPCVSCVAVNLVNAGYGNVKQAVKEFAERIKMAFYYEFEELIPSIMADRIDELLKEYDND